MEKSFRIIDKKNEILAMLKQAPPTNRGEIWQTLGEIRYHYKITNVKDDEVNKAIVIEASTDFEFNPKHPIFVRINFRDLIFKLAARSFVISGNKLACPYPNLAKAVDKRGVERIPLPEYRETTVVLRPLGASAAEVRVNLLDISKNGLGISISDKNRDYLLRNEQFQLMCINDIPLAGDHKAEIRYVERLSRGVIKSGFVLKTPFKDEVFENVCKIIFGNSLPDHITPIRKP
ncbi:MAG TPA: hypothetical protein VNJ08_03280 [Bacteriovoracaceae bacterium]|nr:hypothetical protein [Bacteriovoracaceae bacterium]